MLNINLDNTREKMVEGMEIIFIKNTFLKFKSL